MNKLHLIFFFTFCLVSSCKSTTESEIDEYDDISIQDADLKASNSVVLIGETDDKKAFDFINILDFSNFFAGRSNYQKELNLNNSQSIRLDSVKSPRIIEIMMFGENGKFYNSRMFISPGDTIQIQIKNGLLKFDGINAVEHNFYLELDSLYNQWTKNGYNGNINDYKTKSVALEKKREEFFKNYIKEHPEVSKEFVNQVQSELKFEYLYNLVAPRSIKVEGTNTFINNLQGIVSTLENESNIGDGEMIDFEKYFDNITIEEFDQPQLINNDYYKRSLIQLIRHYFTNQQYIDYNEENFETELNYIKNNLKGEIAKYATGRLIHDFFQKGFGQDEFTKKRMQNEIDNFQSQELQPSFRLIADEIENKLEVINTTITETILDEKLIDIYNDTITLRTVLTNNKNLKLLNFWAFEDRCEPCVLGIKASKSLKQKLNKNDNIEWIHISIENNKDKWLNDIDKLEDFMLGSPQYKVAEDMMRSKLLKYFRIRDNQIIELPRYTLIDYDGTVLLNNAPRPNDSTAFYKAFDKIMQ